MENTKKTCPLCGNGCCSEERKEEKSVVSEKKDFFYRSDENLAILLALVPAMALSLFNLMGLF